MFSVFFQKELGGKQEKGTLLAFQNQDGKPVALISDQLGIVTAVPLELFQLEVTAKGPEQPLAAEGQV